MPLHRLRYKHNDERDCYYTTKRTPYNALMVLPGNVIEGVFDFAFNMTFGEEGQHRNYRTGGRHRRRNGEIFINAFQGKLAEFGFYSFCTDNGIELNEPDLERWELGRWDLTDFEYQGNNIAVKSTKHYGDLLLLETEDWNENAVYIPSEVFYNFIFLVRLRPDGERVMRVNRMLFNDNANTEELKRIILGQVWDFDIPGYITGEQLQNEIINAEPPFILPQRSYLNCRIPMDAENYYVQSGDLERSESFLNLF